MKRFFEYILMGAGTALGYFGITKMIGVFQDPVKKANLKRKFKNVKDQLFDDGEES